MQRDCVVTQAAGGKRPLQTATRTPVARRVTGISVLAITAVVGTTASALDLDGDDGLISETIARRERLKDYDNIKKYGAERVADRDRSYVNPQGLRFRNYLIFPSLEGVVIHDDNIFGRDADKVADIRTEIAPEVQFRSQLPRHILNFKLGGRLVDYAWNDDQDYENVRGSVDGALHIDHAHTLAVHALSELTHEERNSITAPRQAAGPVPVFHNRVTAGITRDVGKLYGTLQATAESFDFQDVEDLNGDTIDQDGRDTTIYSATLRNGYRFSPGYELQTKVRVLRQLNAGLGNSDLDAMGYEALAGLAMETNPLLRWRILGGVGLRDFEDGELDNVLTTLVEAEVQWLPTQRMTVYGTARREIIDTLSAEAGGRVETALEGRVEYDVYHNLVLRLDASYTQADFLGFSREDETIAASIGLDYYLNKNWLFTFAYEHEVRDSTDNLFDSTRNRFRVGAKLQF